MCFAVATLAEPHCLQSTPHLLPSCPFHLLPFSIYPPPPPRFLYDHSFNSHDESDPSFATQEAVYNNIGRPLLRQCFEGYNCCLFAYGQTGSGKSYSMMGIPGGDGDATQSGVIPRFCGELFDRIDKLSSPSVRNGREGPEGGKRQTNARGRSRMLAPLPLFAAPAHAPPTPTADPLQSGD